MGNDFNVKLILEYIKNNNLTNDEFCRICKISKKELNLVLKNNFNISSVVIAKIAKTLNIKLCEMFI